MTGSVASCLNYSEGLLRRGDATLSSAMLNALLNSVTLNSVALDSAASDSATPDAAIVGCTPDFATVSTLRFLPSFTHAAPHKTHRLKSRKETP